MRSDHSEMKSAVRWVLWEVMEAMEATLPKLLGRQVRLVMNYLVGRDGRWRYEGFGEE